MPGFNEGGFSSGNMGPGGNSQSSSGSRNNSSGSGANQARSHEYDQAIAEQQQRAQAARVESIRQANRVAEVQANLGIPTNNYDPKNPNNVSLMESLFSQQRQKQQQQQQPNTTGTKNPTNTAEDINAIMNGTFDTKRANTDATEDLSITVGNHDKQPDVLSDIGNFISDQFTDPFSFTADHKTPGFADDFTAAANNPTPSQYGFSNQDSYFDFDNEHMDRPTFETDPFGGDEGGNYQAIQNFLANPTYGNIPTNQFDTTAGLNALEQALLGVDDTVSSRGFEGLGYAESGRNRARDIFDNFGAGQQFDDLLNFETGQQFGTDALNDTQNQFRTDFTGNVNDRFGPDFEQNLIDPAAFTTTVDNILGDRRDSASRIIGNAGARGNLSTAGQLTANESLETQSAGARDRLTGVARGVESQGQQGLTGIADEARGGASDFTLGDSAFDVSGFSDRADTFRSDTSGSFNSDVDAALGSDPLFDSGTALSTAAGSQGTVSGAPSFLDSIANRQGSGSSNTQRRGLGSRGSGTF